MELVDKRIRLFAQSSAFFFLILAFTNNWYETSLYKYNGISVSGYFSEISSASVAMVFIVAIAIISVLSMVGILLLLGKIFAHLKDFKSELKFFDRWLKYLFAAISPLAFFLCINVFPTDFWGFRFFLFMAALISFAQVWKLSERQVSKVLVQQTKKIALFRNYNTSIPHFLIRVLPIQIYFLVATTLLLSWLKKELHQDYAYYALIVAGIGFVFYSVYFIISRLFGKKIYTQIKENMNNKDVESVAYNDPSDFIFYFNIFLSVLIIVLFNHQPLFKSEGLVLKFLLIFFISFNLVTAFQFLKNLTLRFYGGWLFAIGFLLYNLLFLK